MTFSSVSSVHLAILAAALWSALGMTLPVGAQVVDRGNIVLSASQTPDPAPSGGLISYAIAVKNDSTVTAKGVAVTMLLPAGSEFSKCTTSAKGTPCDNPSPELVTTTLTKIAGHATAKITLVARAPEVGEKTTLPLVVHAHVDRAVGGEEPRDGDVTLDVTLLADTAKVVFLPGSREGKVACGGTVRSSTFQGDETTIQLTASLGCATHKVGLTMAASGKTLDLNRFKIVGAATDLVKGSVGILIAEGADDVTVLGGGTRSSNGIEYFDYCFMDGGGNSGLTVKDLRCFRGRSAGFDIVSDNVELNGLLVDRVVGGGSATTEVPGGVGIHAKGKVHVRNTLMRRIGSIALWGDQPVDAGDTDRGVLMDGDLKTSRIEASPGVGIRLDGRGHRVKDTYVEGDGRSGTSTDGLVLNGPGIVVDGVDIVDFAGNGIVGAGAGIQILRTNIEDVVGDAFVITGDGARLAGNTATKGGRGYVITGAGVFIDTNATDQVTGDSFVVEGAGAIVSNNKANRGQRGYVVIGPDAVLDTNEAEFPLGNGFEVSGDRSVLTGNKVTKGKLAGFVLDGVDANVRTNRADSNGRDGFVIGGSNGKFENNVSKKQSKPGAAGFNVTGTGNTFGTNSAESNKGFEWVICAGNIDSAATARTGPRSPCAEGRQGKFRRRARPRARPQHREAKAVIADECGRPTITGTRRSRRPPPPCPSPRPARRCCAFAASASAARTCTSTRGISITGCRRAGSSVTRPLPRSRRRPRGAASPRATASSSSHSGSAASAARAGWARTTSAISSRCWGWTCPAACRSTGRCPRAGSSRCRTR